MGDSIKNENNTRPGRLRGQKGSNIMKQLHRDCAGHYYCEMDLYTLRIYKIKRGLWGVCKDRGMTVKTFRTLREARKYYGV